MRRTLWPDSGAAVGLSRLFRIAALSCLLPVAVAAPQQTALQTATQAAAQTAKQTATLSGTGVSAETPLPRTPAGQQFAAWLAAFNSGKPQDYREFITAHAPELVKYIDDDLQFAAVTGGFRLQRLDEGDDCNLGGLLSEPWSDVLTRFTIKVDPAPSHDIVTLDIGGAERPADMPLPVLDEAGLVAALGERLDAQSASGRFSGVVLLARGEHVLLERACGFSDVERQERNALDTRFGIASMGKMFTAVAILQLARAGKLDLQAPLVTYFPDYPNADIAQHVTLHHLLTHTGGTGDIFVPEIEALRGQILSPDDYVAVLGERAPDFPPGAEWRYSNYGYVLLGCVIERVSGESCLDYIRKHVFAPAHMLHSGEPALAGQSGPTATGYMRSSDSQDWVVAPRGLPDVPSPAGGGLSTARDMHAFALALQQGTLLDAASVELLTRGKVAAPYGSYAYGFKDQSRHGLRYVGHGGSAPGTNAELDLYPDSGHVVVVLTNQDPPFGNRIADFIGNRLPAHALARPATTASSQLVTSSAVVAPSAVVSPSVLAAAVDPLSALAGHWEGAFSREGAVQLCALDVGMLPSASASASAPASASAASPGADTGTATVATLDIPELGMFAEPLEACALDGTAVRLHCVYGDFVGVLHGEQGEITALNDHWGPPLRLHLKRASRPPQVLVRRDVSFDSPGADGGPARLAGTLLLPLTASSAAPVPGLVLMHGSDIGDRGAWEYRGWGELLARQGIAVLLFDRRGSGASPAKLPEQGSTFDDLAADALAAHACLARQSGVKAARVGLLGASQSGWTAPLAATRSPAVAFLVLLSPPGVSVFEQELQRVEHGARAFESDDGATLSDEDVTAAVDFTHALLDACRASDREAAFAALAPRSGRARAAPWASLVQIPERPADLAWFAAHAFDPADTLAHVGCPVLAFWGERDTAVPPSLNLPPLRDALAHGLHPSFTSRVWPDCGHDLERGRRLIGDDWAWPASAWVWARKPPGLVDDIATWVRER